MAGCVPLRYVLALSDIASEKTYNLELNGLAVQLDGSDFLPSIGVSLGSRLSSFGTYEVDTNRGNVGLRVGIIGKSQQQAGLSDPRVSDKQKLEQIIISVGIMI